jgi:hypothetical protein
MSLKMVMIRTLWAQLLDSSESVSTLALSLLTKLRYTPNLSSLIKELHGFPMVAENLQFQT